MSQQLTLHNLDRDKVELLKTTICKGATDDELKLFIHACNQAGLDPFMRQIHAVKRWDSTAKREVMAIQVGIDGYRLIAERTGKYAPGPEPTFCYDNDGRLVSATAYVKKLTSDGTWHTVSASAFFSEYCQRNKEGMPIAMWKNMPHGQLAKCLPYNAGIETDMGYLPIGVVVNKKLPVKVRSLNFETGLEEWKPVTGWVKNSGTTEWLKLTVPNNVKGNSSYVVTPEHQVFTSKGWKAAKDIELGDGIAVASAVLSNEQRQIILGSLLGDGSLAIQKSDRSCPAFYETHSIKQLDYLMWKFRNLSNLRPKLEFFSAKCQGKEYDSCRFRSESSPCLYEIYQSIYKTENGCLRHVLNELDDLAVSVWIMDDGSLKSCGGIKPSLKLYTCAYEDQIQFVEFFQNKYGITPTILRQHKNPYLAFSCEDTNWLLGRLKDHIQYDHSINDKSWKSVDIVMGVDNGFVFTPLLKSEYFNHKGRVSRGGYVSPIGRYDITVKDNHNFMYQNIVTHNCAESQALRKSFPAELSGVYTTEEMEQADSMSAQMPIDPPITADQVKELELLMHGDEEGLKKLMGWANVTTLADIKVSKYSGVQAACQRRAKQRLEEEMKQIESQSTTATEGV